MYGQPAARFDDVTNSYQQSMAGYLSAPFLQPAPEQRGCAAASSGLPPIVMKASRHDESQTTPRQKSVHAALAAHYREVQQLEASQQHARVYNIEASAVGGYQRPHAGERTAVGGTAEPGTTARASYMNTGAAPASARYRAAAPVSAPLQQGVIDSSASGTALATQQPAKYTQSGTLRTAAELLNSLTSLACGGASAGVGQAASQGSAAAAVSAPRPFHLPPVFSNKEALPTSRKMPPPATSRPPMTSRVAPLSSSPYLQAVPGYNPSRSTAAQPLPPGSTVFVPPKSARAGGQSQPPDMYHLLPQQQSQQQGSQPASTSTRIVPMLMLAQQQQQQQQQVQHGGPAAGGQSARPTKSNIYTRMSQGLPAIETPRSTRAQQLLRLSVGGSQEFQQPDQGSGSMEQPQLQQQLQQLRGPLATQHYANRLGQNAIPLDSPTTSTGLTPRTARLMQQRVPNAVEGLTAAAAMAELAAALAVQPPQQLAVDSGLGQPGQFVGDGAPRDEGQAVRRSSYAAGLASFVSGPTTKLVGPTFGYAGEKRLPEVDAQDVLAEETIKAHKPAAAPTGLADAQQPYANPWNPFPSSQQLQAAVQASAAVGLPGEVGLAYGNQADLVYDLQHNEEQLQQSRSAAGWPPSAQRPHQPLPSSSMLSADMSPSDSIHSMPALYQAAQLQPLQMHASYSAETFQATDPFAPEPPTPTASASAAAAAAAAALHQEQQHLLYQQQEQQQQLYQQQEQQQQQMLYQQQQQQEQQQVLLQQQEQQQVLLQQQEQQQQLLLQQRQQQHQVASQPASRKPSFQDESPAPAVPAAMAASSASRPTSGRTVSRAASRGTPPTRPGLPGAFALRQAEALLTPFEQSEILSMQEVWFVGRQSARKIQGDRMSGEPNSGYDDGRGDYQTVVGDHINYRYEVLDVLGRGSFGQVLRCLDHATQQAVALKIIRNKRRFQKQAQIEADILRKLQDGDPNDSVNIVRTYSSFTFRNHLCITFELLSLNLYEFIKSINFQGSSLVVIRRVAQQVLECLQFLLRQRIVHCDLKPENILLVERGKTAVKVIDFGSSCYVDQRMYTYIQSRFYRSPEVILGLPYGPPIDMWSLGCILAELLTGQPIFPGEDEKEQLACIMEIMGAPPASLVQAAPRANLFFNMGTGAPLPCPPNSRGRTHRPGSISLVTALKGCEDQAFLDFMRGCLEWDPERRLTPDQALQHEWITRGASVRTPPGPLSRLSSAQGGLLYRHASNMSANSAVPVPLLIPVPVSARVSIK